MKSFICKLFLIMLISSIKLLAQTLDPYKFFPSSVGNVWEYNQVWGFAREELYKDSVGENGNRYLFYKYNDYYKQTPSYKINLNFPLVYSVPFNPIYPHWLDFKLDADSGDIWIVDSLMVGGNTIYKLALCRNQYEGFFFGYYTTFKEITFYQYQFDTTLNEFSWPDYTITLAYGIGEVMHFDEEGGGPQRILQGCIIDGDTIGIITNVEDNYSRVNSFELFQNFPNPFNPLTRIKYAIKGEGFVTLKVYDLLGREITTLLNEPKQPGEYEVEFDASKYELSSGVYLYRLKSGSYTATKKFVYLR